MHGITNTKKGQMIRTAVDNRWLDSCCLPMISRIRKREKHTLVFWIITPCCTRQGLPENLRNISPTVMVPLSTVDCAPIPQTTKLF